MNEPHDIDHILMQRALPHAPHDLADRILYRAARTPQTTRFSWSGMMGECLSYVMIPRPALAFGLCLMIGMFGGWSSTQSADAGFDSNETAQLMELAAIEEDWL